MDTGIFDALVEDLLLIAAVLHQKKKCPQTRTKWVYELKFLANVLCLLGYHIYLYFRINRGYI